MNSFTPQAKFSGVMKNLFTSRVEILWKELTEKILSACEDDEEMILNLHAEESDFIRFNGCKVRQNTRIAQIELSLELRQGSRVVIHTWTLSGNSKPDLDLISSALPSLREELKQVGEDPFVTPIENHGRSHMDFPFEQVPFDKITSLLEKNLGQLDLAGIFCQGPVVKANANSKGQNHWFSTGHFFIDYSLFDGPRAVKGLYSEATFNDEKVDEHLFDSQRKLELLRRSRKRVSPGSYRVYLAPSAVSQILAVSGWGGLSEASYRRGQSGFQKAARGEVSLSPLFSLKENLSLGLVPRFNYFGEVRQEELPLFEKGVFKQFLVSTATAKEFGISSNFADRSEHPRSLEVLPGDLLESEILSGLGDGLYLSNLHYLNWSDLNSGRITGMSRYACFWVEKSEIVSPIEDLRFDDSVLNIFGRNLERITRHQEVLPETGSYRSRSLGGVKVPGLLLKGFDVKF